jgi:hypothetical protein
MWREISNKYTCNGYAMWPIKSSKTYRFGRFITEHQGCILEHPDIDVIFNNYGTKPHEVITKAETIIVKRPIKRDIITDGIVKFICCGSNMAAINAGTVVICLASPKGCTAWYNNFATFKYTNNVVKTVIIYVPYVNFVLPVDGFNSCRAGGIIDFAVNCFKGASEIRISASIDNTTVVNIKNVLKYLSKPPAQNNICNNNICNNNICNNNSCDNNSCDNNSCDNNSCDNSYYSDNYNSDSYDDDSKYNFNDYDSCPDNGPYLHSDGELYDSDGNHLSPFQDDDAYYYSGGSS